MALVSPGFINSHSQVNDPRPKDNLVYSCIMRMPATGTRGVHLIVTLGFCKARYETYPYCIHFN